MNRMSASSQKDIKRMEVNQSEPVVIEEPNSASDSIEINEASETAPGETDGQEESFSTETDWQAKHDELYNQYLRLAADFDNFRKRFAQEVEGARRYGTETTLHSLLPFLDNMDRASRTLSDQSDPKTLFQSFSLVKKQLLEALETTGLKRMDVVGQTFDPNLHEAVAKVPMADQPDQSILDEQQTGYMLNDKVLRVPQVVVAIRPESEAGSSPSQPSGSQGDNNPFSQ